MDYTIHGILQPRGSSQPRDQTQVSRVAGGFLTSRATREALITHLVKNPLAMRETRVQLLGPKDPLANSFWQPYIQTLPSEYDTPLYFEEDEVRYLQSTQAIHDVFSQYKNTARQYAYFYKVIQVSGC